MPARSATRDERASRSHDGHASASANASDASDVGVLDRIAPGLAAPVRAACFWTAIVLPFLHVPLLATGLETIVETSAFGLLVGLNVLTLLVGHPHRS